MLFLTIFVHDIRILQTLIAIMH